MANKIGIILELTLLGFCFNYFETVNAHVLVYRRLTNQLIEEYNDLPAQFGPSLPSNGIKVFAIPSSSEYACEPIHNPPRTTYPNGAKFVAIISRGGDCTFERKVRIAQNATYYAVIIYNNDGDDLEQMSADNSSGIHIPSVFVGHTTGKTLLSFYTSEVLLIINDELPFNINTQLILPFSILIGLCFLIMVMYMIYKCIREQRRQRRHRLPKSMLKKIPILRYTKNNTNIKYETCVICLEDFVDDDKLRVLPCSHPYHSHCIDPWLTENRRVCPMCKRKVFTKGETRASRNRQPSLDSVFDTDDDTTPLLQQPPNNNAAAAGNATAGTSTTSRSANRATTTRHGTFRRAEDQNNDAAQNSSDDELNALLDHQSPTHRRVNPFDRTPNLPAHLAVQLSGPRPSFWARLSLRFPFSRQPTNISVAAPPFLEHVESGQRLPDIAAVAATAALDLPPSSNNILNPNLSGSFKDDDDIPPHHSIYEPIAINTPAAADTSTATVDSAFIQTPTQGGIGVAALPSNETDSSNRRQFLI